MNNADTPPPLHSISVKEIRIPVSAVEALTPEQRYTYYLLGHIFNELMCLQKFIAFSLPKHDDFERIRHLPETAQAFFLLRMATCKVWETKKAIKKETVWGILTTDILPNMADGARKSIELISRIEDAEWIRTMRNQFGFHYPCFNTWKEITTPKKEWIEDSILVGEKTGNTFYEGSEHIAREWFFYESENGATSDVVELKIDDMIDLLRGMNCFLEEAIDVFVKKVLHVDEYNEVGEIWGPDFKSTSIPFWTHM